MSIADLVSDMRGAGCSLDQIEAVLHAQEVRERAAQEEKRERGRENNRERQARFRAVRNEDNAVTAVNNASNGHNAVTENARNEPQPRVCAFHIGEEVSILPLENATHSIPKGKNELAEPKTKKPRQRVSRLTEDFSPTPSMRNYAHRHGLSDAQIEAEAEAMRDWSLSSQAGAKLDWEATWRGWVRRSRERAPSRAGPINGHAPPRPAPLSPRMQALSDIANEQPNHHDEQTYAPASDPDASGGAIRAIGWARRAG